MQPEKLTAIKKELIGQESSHLVDYCLRLAKFKKENKELLSYLLYHAHDPHHYIEQVKETLQGDFENLPRGVYQSIKSLRKILRKAIKHAKYTALKEVEVEILLWFCTNFLQYADTRSSNKSLKNLFIKQAERISKLIAALHEDLQFDYRQELNVLLQNALKLKSFSKSDLSNVTIHS